MKQQKKIILYFALSVLILISLTACQDKTKKYEEAEATEIQNYLAKNSSLNFELKASGLYYLEVQQGTGLQPVAHDTVYVFYTLYYLDGTQLDTNVGTTDTLSFPVAEGYVINGFYEGVTYMKVGGKSKLLIPSSLGYGPYGDYSGTISGYTPLLFDINLVRVKKGPVTK